MTRPSLRLVPDRPGVVMAELLADIPGAVVVERSEPRFCVVCRERQQVFSRWLIWRGFGAVACPHCTSGPDPIPVVYLPSWRDVPSGDAA